MTSSLSVVSEPPSAHSTTPKKKRGGLRSLFRKKASSSAAATSGGASTSSTRQTTCTTSKTRRQVEQEAARFLKAAPPSEINVEDSPSGTTSVLTETHVTPRTKNPHLTLPTLSEDRSGPSSTMAELERVNQRTNAATEDDDDDPRKLRSSCFSRSNYFKRMSEWAFEIVDADGSGEVDKKELYSGLLLIHLNLAMYAGPAACRPVSRERVELMFEKMDEDKSGTLDKEEFHDVMTMLCSQVFTRIILQWSMTLIIVPLIAQYLLDCMWDGFWFLWQYAQDNVEEWDALLDMCWETWVGIQNRMWNALPDVLADILTQVWEVVEDIPESVWMTVPLTLMSCILGVLVVPYLLFKVDDFYKFVADRREKAKKKKKA